MAEPITTPSTEAVAQSRDATAPATLPGGPPCPGRGAAFDVDPAVTLAQSIHPYERAVDDPVYRPLRIFTLDPTVSALDGATAVLNVPYEPLAPGPVGAFIEVVSQEGAQPLTPVKLDDPRVLIGSGLPPSTTNHQFHQQMVYAVASSVCAAFRLALGRHLAWGFPGRLRIHPHVPDLQNAFYDKSNGSIAFGFFPASANTVGNIPPNALVFTCLSHDIIVHEMTHALLDGLRVHFMEPTNPDVPAFHEAFADLVAIFQHFTYREVLEKQIQAVRGELRRSTLLTGIAREFGYTVGATQGLRTAIDTATEPDAQVKYDAVGPDPYARGSVLVSAVFDAFLVVVQRKTERYVRLATNGTGVLGNGRLPADLVTMLAESATKIAGEFLSICIRALDYCPPVDITFGEYLRALITADRDLVPDDKWAYREAMIDAFAARRIYPTDVRNLSEDALVWRSPRRPIAPMEPLMFGALRFAGDPSSPADANELRRQACALGEIITRPENLATFGLAAPGDGCERPCVRSIRTSRRVGPAGQVVFDLVAEVTQRRLVRDPTSGRTTTFLGGVTIILDPTGVVRYTILKSVLNAARLERQLAHQRTSALWIDDGHGHLVPDPHLFQRLHRGRY